MGNWKASLELFAPSGDHAVQRFSTDFSCVRELSIGVHLLAFHSKVYKRKIGESPRWIPQLRIS